MKLDGEQFFKRLMVVLLTLRAECSLFTLKPAHLSPHLPADTEKVYLGIITADTAAEALQKASEYWEYPSHDLVCEQIA